MDSGQHIHVRQIVKQSRERDVVVPPDLSDVDIEDLQRVLRSVLRRIPVEPPAPSVRRHEITLSQQVDRVRDFMRVALRSARDRKVHVRFSDVLSSSYTRSEVIVTFLAILELIKQEELTVRQDAVFGDIYLIPLALIESSGEDVEQ